MANSVDTVERIRSGVDRLVSGAVDATVHLPLGIYDRTRDQLSDIDAKRVRRTFEGLLEGLIDRGQDRIRPLERRLKREGRKVEGEVSQIVDKAKRATSSAKKTAKKNTQRAKKTTRKTTSKTAQRAKKTTSKTTRKTAAAGRAPRVASELPIASYATLTADEIVSRLTGLTQTDLAKVYKFEKAHGNRATILDAIDDRLVALPIPTYDALTADEIIERLEKLDESELRSLKRYEAATKMRATVLERIDSRLS